MGRKKEVLIFLDFICENSLREWSRSSTRLQFLLETGVVGHLRVPFGLPTLKNFPN
jgi:hypothetical protein